MSVKIQTLLWPSVCDALTSKFDIVGAFNLNCFEPYDMDMGILADKLEAYRSKSFNSNERIVFTLYDVEYYLPTSKIGLTINNLVELLYSMDIDFSFCMLFTNYHGISVAIKDLCSTYRSQSLRVIENNFCVAQTDIFPVEERRDPLVIKYKFSFLSNIRRDHRTYLRCYIEDRKLNDQTLMAWSPINNDPVASRPVIPAAKPRGDRPLPCVFVQTTPWTRIRDKVMPDGELHELFNKNSYCLSTKIRNEPITPFGNGSLSAEFLKCSFVNIAAESVFNYPYPFITEKTFKCFWHQLPFVVAGGSGCLAYLHSIGFKTFGQWWPEDYDLIQDPTDRLKEIFKVLDIISKWSLEDCRRVYNEMWPVIEHNSMHYTNYYCQTLLNNTIESL